MIQKIRLLWYCLILIGCVGCCSRPESADLLLTSAVVYTVNGARPWAQAIAIRDGTIIAVGTNKEITDRFEGPTESLDGRMVVPGFHDAHLHLLMGGVQLMQCNLSGLAAVPALLEKIRSCDAALVGGQWLVGGGWNLALFDESNPSKSLLDAINSQRPIFLRAEDGYSSWANSRTLSLAGIEAERPDPIQRVIERDGEGEPSGTLRESAQALVESVVPALMPEDYLQAGRLALQLANSDWFVSSMNPLKAIETAVTRVDEAGLVEAVLNINERMSLPAMIDLYTRNGA